MSSTFTPVKYADKQVLFEPGDPALRFYVIQSGLVAIIDRQHNRPLTKLSAGGQKLDVSAGDSFTLNEIDRTEKVEDLHVLKSAAGYILELRGKTGESRASRPEIGRAHV